VVERVWAQGGRFDSWSENFDFARWEDAWRREGIDPEFYLRGERGLEEIMPWEHIDFGIDKQFLREEYGRALKGEVSTDCRDGVCLECGVCSRLDAEVSLSGEWR
jgi:hypothetical protein